MSTRAIALDLRPLARPAPGRTPPRRWHSCSSQPKAAPHRAGSKDRAIASVQPPSASCLRQSSARIAALSAFGNKPWSLDGRPQQKQPVMQRRVSLLGPQIGGQRSDIALDLRARLIIPRSQAGGQSAQRRAIERGVLRFPRIEIEVGPQPGPCRGPLLQLDRPHSFERFFPFRAQLAARRVVHRHHQRGNHHLSRRTLDRQDGP